MSECSFQPQLFAFEREGEVGGGVWCGVGL